jgi:hypothetical protein
MLNTSYSTRAPLNTPYSMVCAKKTHKQLATSRKRQEHQVVSDYDYMMIIVNGTLTIGKYTCFDANPSPLYM